MLLPCAPASIAVARQVISDEMTAAGMVDSAICDAVLIVSELFSNAIKHAYPLPGGRLRLAWELDGGWVEIAVSDGGGTTLPHAARPPASAQGGRGLSIVAHLSDAWGVRSEEGGLTVWALLRAPRRDATVDTGGPVAASSNSATSCASADG